MISSPTRHLFKFFEMVHFLTCGEDKLSSEKVSPHLSSRIPRISRVLGQAKMSLTPLRVREALTGSGRLASATMQSIEPKGA